MQRSFLPLHPAQRDVYTDQLINTKSPHYNIGGYIKLTGSLNKEKFNEAVNSAPNVFDAFKLRFDHNAAEPVCYFDKEYVKLPIAEINFSGHDKPEQEALAWVQKRFSTPLLIKEELLPYEECLLTISDNEHWFFGKYHHLITDGYGFIVFIKYLAQKYKSLTGEETVKFDYSSYIDELFSASAYFNSAEYELDSAYWMNKIGTIPKKILPRKYNQPELAGNTSGTYVYNLSPHLQKSLADLQAATRSGIQQLTIAALLIYFGKISGQSEFLFGIPVHKRGSRKLRNIVGMFSGILPYKGSYRKDMKLADLLKDISISQKTDYRHQNYPIGDLSRNLKAKPADGYLYQVSIDYEPLNFEMDFGDQLQAGIARVSNDHESNPLQLCWLEYGNGQSLKLQFHYGKAYFNQPEIELFANRVIYIIEQFPNALQKEIGDIEILPPSERALIDHFNNTAAGYPPGKTIVDLFEYQALKNPGNIALVFEGKEITYKKLDELSNQLGHYLKSKGATKETLVPLCIKRSVEMIVGILGIVKAGAAYVPIDPEYPEERIRFMLEDTNAAIIVTNQECVEKLRFSETAECILLDNDRASIGSQSVEKVTNGIAENSLAYIIYTSGSTGRPKGVMIEHSGVVNLIHAQTSFFKISADEKILQFSNYCFDASVEQIFLALFNGATLMMFPEGLQVNIDLFENFLQEKGISHIHATPAFLENLHPIKYDGLKRVIAGGESCKKELASLWKNKVNFYNEYGPTETTVTSVEYHDQTDLTEETNSLPIGKPIANTQLYILDRNKSILPIGVEGELFIAGAGVARGYLNRPELTSEKFISNPFSNDPASRMYDTGDLVRMLPDGIVEYLGRIDEQVKIRGYRIELGEIENVLQEFDAVKQAVVLAREDNQGNKRLVGFVVPEGPFDRDAIQFYLRRKLPDYMVPALWVQLDSIPLTSNGKVDKKALPNPDASEIMSNEYVAPGNEMEFQLAAIWAEILKAERVGVNDNFFELGGHSLNAIQLTSRLHKLLNIKTDIGTVFSNPTIRQLCKALVIEKQNLFVEIKRLPEQEFYPLSHAQKRFWILSHFKDGSEAYNVSSAFTIEGNLDIKAFKNAFDAVIERHEILRTVFLEIEGEPMQKILSREGYGFFIEEIDLQNNTNSESIIKKWLEEDSRRPFDLSAGPLLRATIFQEAAGKFIIVFNIHHIISDGWSKGIFINEVLAFYKAFSTGGNISLPQLAIQYRDYASWHTNFYEMQGQYWRDLYKNGVPVLNFPVDFERPKVLTFFGAMLHISVSETLTQGLRKMAIEHNMSLNNLLFALYGLLLGRFSGQEEVVIGSLSSGRSHMDLESLVGVFINFLPVKLSPHKESSLPAYLENSHQALVQAYNNQDYPFDLMVDECIQHRDISRNPFFDTMVNFHLENDIQDKTAFGKDQFAETGISIKPYKAIQEDLFQSVLDFKLDIEMANNMLDFYLSYNSKLFSPESMNSFLAQFVELLTTAVNEPGRLLKEYGSWEEKNTAMLSRDNNESFMPSPVLPLNICASFVMEPVQEYVEYWSNELELNIKVSFAPYNQVFQQLVNPQSLLNTGGGINVLFIRIADWIRDHTSSQPSELLPFLDQTYAELIKAIENTGKNTSVPFLVGIVPANGNSYRVPEVAKHISQLNVALGDFIEKQTRFHLIDLYKIAALYDVTDLFDVKSDELGHMPFTQEMYAATGTYLARKANAFKGHGYKVIALDCDNTLWKGVCGELGALEVTIDENFNQLQEFVLEKYKEGFLLVLCSKNNEADVWEVFDRHPGMKLKREHIAAHRINWEPKSGNILSISSELNLGLNSFIFLDDSEFEIEQMSLRSPDVLSISLPENPDEIKNFLDHIWAFDYFRVTEEDAKRNEMYQVEKQRKEEQLKHGSLEDFIGSLDIKINISPLTDQELERAVQLTLRTNQFNLNGIRKTREEIVKWMNNENSISWIIDVKDRFGEYGIVGVVLANELNNTMMIETFLLSCRVLGRNVEDHILNELQKYGESRGYSGITALFQVTSKNKPFQEFLSRTEWVQDPLTNTYSRILKISEQISA